MENEKRLIDANALMEEAYDSDEKQGNDVWHTGDIEYLVMAQPTVDAVEVVRCKDCKFPIKDDMYGGYWCNGSRVPSNWYCADGERRTDNERKAD